MAVFGFFFFYLLSYFWTFLLALFDIFPYYSTLLLPTGFSQMLFALLALCIVPAFCEEWFFRGFLLRKFKEGYSVKSAFLLVSFFFAFMHGSLGALPTHLGLSFLLTFIAIKSGTFVYGILYHFIHNSISLLVSVFFSKWLHSLPREALSRALHPVAES
ncbi:MAG: CPBP family intramembrane metalloprotease, partial [Clostridiales bacterium]|nr:CPBP family intramembrane metalloprotease [Clostridiales bacterium]